MAYKLMIQGTMSSAGKSFIVTGLCRLFSNLGYRVAPFKSQNMALNSGVTFDGLEMGRAQIVQAEAAHTVPDVRMNPILLKPNSDIGSQVIVMGKPIGNMKAKDYYDYKTSLIPVIKEAFHSLEDEYDIIIVEGAGSPAEINLKENDIVNMGLAKLLDIPVLLCGDIDLGGVFAQLLGTLEWLTEEERERIKGLIINKFRGDEALLKPGIDMLTQRTGKDVVGVIPYSRARIDEEDSVTVKSVAKENTCDKDYKKIYIIRLPHMSNFTDFNPLGLIDGVIVRYIDRVDDIPDLLIIPGSKSTIDDLQWMKENGLFTYVQSLKGKAPIIGICGGNQILGRSVSDPLCIEGGGIAEGLCLLDQTTELKSGKVLTKVSGTINCSFGFFSCLNGTEYEGYEIHSGITEEIGFEGDVFGTYVHGIFDKASVTRALMRGLGVNEESLKQIKDYEFVKDSEYDAIADTLSNSLDLDMIFEIMGINREKNE